MTPFTRLRRFAAPIAAAVATAAVFTGALWVQHSREAWPFAPRAQPAAAMDMPTAVATTGSGSTHDRVPIDVTASTLQELDIRLEVVTRESLTQAVRAVATVVPDESADLARAHPRGGMGRTARRQHHGRDGSRGSAARTHLLAGTVLVPDRVPGHPEDDVGLGHHERRGRRRSHATDRPRDDAGGHRRDRADRRTEAPGHRGRPQKWRGREPRRHGGHVRGSVDDAAHDCRPVARVDSRRSAGGEHSGGARRHARAARLSGLRPRAVRGPYRLRLSDAHRAHAHAARPLLGGESRRHAQAGALRHRRL